MADTTDGYLKGSEGFMDFLSWSPEAAYFGSRYAPSTGASPTRQRTYEQSFGNIYNQWLGDLGRYVRQGGDPLGYSSFADYVDTPDAYGMTPFEQRFATMSPSQRNTQSAIYAPRTRQVYF